jgi:hypothetical protein
VITLLIILAVLAGLIGFAGLTTATMGVGLIAGGCLMAILARLAQAEMHHQAIIRATRSTPATLSPVESVRPISPPTPPPPGGLGKRDKIIVAMAGAVVIFAVAIGMAIQRYERSAQPDPRSTDVTIAVLSDRARIRNTSAVAQSGCVASIGKSQAKLATLQPNAETFVLFSEFQPDPGKDAVFQSSGVVCES